MEEDWDRDSSARTFGRYRVQTPCLYVLHVSLHSLVQSSFMKLITVSRVKKRKQKKRVILYAREPSLILNGKIRIGLLYVTGMKESTIK